jgi:hypothetical protein
MQQYYWGFNDKVQFGKYNGYSILQIITMNPKYLKGLHCKGIITLHPVVVEFLKSYLNESPANKIVAADTSESRDALSDRKA